MQRKIKMRGEHSINPADRKAAKQFISKFPYLRGAAAVVDHISSCSSSTAWAVVTGDTWAEHITSSILEAFHRVLADHSNPDIKNNKLLLAVQFFRQAYTNQPYELIMTNLVLLAKSKNYFTTQLPIHLLYGLLKDNNEFRDCFQMDDSLLPFFKKEFFSSFIEYIDIQDEVAIKDELLRMCQDASTRTISSQLIREELIKDLGFDESALTSIHEDLITLARLLTNKDAVFMQLEKLECELENAAGEVFDRDKKSLKNYVEDKPWQMPDKKKLLTNYLMPWAKDNGYKGYAIFNDIIEDRRFNAILSEGGLFKDKGFRHIAVHGDMIHILQQYVITEWWKDHPDELKHHPVELLKWIGRNRSKESDPWEYLYETVHKSSLYEPITPDFRAAGEFNQFILSKDCPFPVLHQLIKSRYNKGDFSSDDLRGFTYRAFGSDDAAPSSKRK